MTCCGGSGQLALIVAMCLQTVGMVGLASAADPLPDADRRKFEQAAGELQTLLDRHGDPQSTDWVDAAIWHKGLQWALRYDREFTPTDRGLLQRAVDECRERLTSHGSDTGSGSVRRGRMALGYRSRVDGSAQPYGVIVSQAYVSGVPLRLDVVLHGSTKPVGMSELRFMARFDAQGEAPPEQPFIELHPLGRVENCYRWSGETDVFETIEDVCRRFSIDRGRVVLRGKSMGASGTWHLGLKHPNRFVALGPYCGYVDTKRFSQSPFPHFLKIDQLPDHQELGLHVLDSVDYAANAGVVPAVACMGEKDVCFDAQVLMGEAMQREGLAMVNLISPGTGHVIDPVTHAEQMRRIAEIAANAPRQPRTLRFVTWMLKYSRCHWLELLGLDRHYTRAEISATCEGDLVSIDKLTDISRFTVLASLLPVAPRRLRVAGTELAIPPEAISGEGRILLVRDGEDWAVASRPDPRWNSEKRPGLQGPIDDAFTSGFLCVRGTGQPWNAGAQNYAEASLRRFAAEWHRYFRGELPIKDDGDVTSEDLRSVHLILFGDPGSNSLIARALPQLPLEWTREKLRLAGQDYAAADCLAALIAPSPLASAGDRYLVLNTGHTFRESKLARVNYLLFPKWGDWAVVRFGAVPSQAEPTGSRPAADRWSKTCCGPDTLMSAGGDPTGIAVSQRR